MKRNVLKLMGEEPDLSIKHASPDNSWGGIDVGKINLLNFTLKANRDIDHDVYVKWKCPCCAEDFCSKDSLVSNMKFVNNSGERVDYLKVGPLRNGQSFYVTAEADLSHVQIEQDYMKSSVGILVFELEEGELLLPQKDNIIHIPSSHNKASDIMAQVSKAFKESEDYKVFFQKEVNLVNIVLLIMASLKDYHIDYLIVPNVNDRLSGGLAVACQLMEYTCSITDMQQIKYNKTQFKAASNVIFVFEESDIVVTEDIAFITKRKGCDVLKVIFIKKNNNQMELTEPAEYILNI